MTTTAKRYLSCAETAKLVRAALHKEFPGIKFYVRSSTYSGGASIDVAWSFGPTSKQVDAILNQYESADFDGMIDLETHKSHWLLLDGSTIVADAEGTQGSMGVIPGEHNPPPAGAVPVSFGAHYVQSQRRFWYKGWEEEETIRNRVAEDMCKLNHCEWLGPNQTVHLFGQGDTEQATQHAWRLMSATAFGPDEEYAGVRWMTDQEWEAEHDPTVSRMVIIKKKKVEVTNGNASNS